MSFCLFLLMAASDNYLTIKSFQRARRPVRLCSLLPVVHKHEHAMSAVSFSIPPSTVPSLWAALQDSLSQLAAGNPDAVLAFSLVAADMVQTTSRKRVCEEGREYEMVIPGCTRGD